MSDDELPRGDDLAGRMPAPPVGRASGLPTPPSTAGDRPHFAAWRLALSSDAIAEVLARPDDAVRVGERGAIRLVTLSCVLTFLFLALFVYADWLDPRAIGPLARFLLMVLMTGLVDAIFFHDIRGAAPREVRVELQDDCLKWMEAIEIGQMPWGELRAIAMADAGLAPLAERRLVVADRFGRRLLFRGAAEAFAPLMERLARERPDLAAEDMTRAIEQAGEFTTEAQRAQRGE